VVTILFFVNLLQLYFSSKAKSPLA
jgi:hypothetical protein